MQLTELCERLSSSSATLDVASTTPQWPREQLAWCAQAGVFRWFVPEAYGGWQWSEREQIEGYLALSQACLTTAFILTQWNAACKRMALSDNTTLRERWLPDMAEGKVFATVGISHLTTSRQHLRTPVLTASQIGQDTYELNGFSPWVTGADHADVIVLGATLDDGRQILCAVPKQRAGVSCGSGSRLIALSPSATDAVKLDRVTVSADEIIAGPVENVMHSGVGGGAGGLQTSTLAIGLTQAAVDFLKAESSRRDELSAIADKLSTDVHRLREELLALVDGRGESTAVRLREQANSLVLRATQAALVAAKGVGFVEGHPAGRWCREALFFLVWSCPQPVLAANLCEFAQV